MGGQEMGYSSDLDLVFLYNPHAKGINSVNDSGNKAYFFSRLVQRLIFLLTTRTSQGVLYDIDTRLRPNGSQGILVSTVESFAEYQKTKAWDWEHQAIIRARFVTGDQGTGELFARIRKEVLVTKRERGGLSEKVFEMRKKITESVKRKGKTESFHLKKDPGGMVDIEFIIQYLVLLHAHEYDELTRATGCMELLGLLEKARLLSPENAGTLKDVFKLYMKTINHLTLDLQEPMVSVNTFEKERGQVEAIFQEVLGVNRSLDTWRSTLED